MHYSIIIIVVTESLTRRVKAQGDEPLYSQLGSKAVWMVETEREGWEEPGALLLREAATPAWSWVPRGRRPSPESEPGPPAGPAETCTPGPGTSACMEWPTLRPGLWKGRRERLKGQAAHSTVHACVHSPRVQLGSSSASHPVADQLCACGNHGAPWAAVKWGDAGTRNHTA